MQTDDITKIKKLEKQLTAAIFLFIIIIAVGAWIIFGLVSKQSVLALGLTGNYSKSSGESLDSSDWNNLDDDFVDVGGDTITGPLTVDGKLIANDNVGVGTNAPISPFNIEKAGYLATADKNWLMDISQRMDTTSVGGLLGIRIGFGGIYAYNSIPHTARSVGIAAVAESVWGNDVGMALYTGGANTGDWSEKVRITSDGNVGIGVEDPDEALHVVGNVKVDGNIIGGGWKLLLEATEWTEEALTTITSSGVNFDTDHGYNAQRINFGKFSWPQYTPSEILLKITNRGDEFCVGGNGVGDIDANGGGVRAKCTDFQYRGTTLSKVNKNPDNWIQLYINDSLLLSCPDPVTNMVANADYPGRFGHNYWSVFCTYERGTDWNGDLNSLKVETADWSDDYSMWEWEIWIR